MALGCAILTSILFTLIQLAVDLFYAFVDPRIKAQYTVVKKKKTAAMPSGNAAGSAGELKTATPLTPLAADSGLSQKDIPAEPGAGALEAAAQRNDINTWQSVILPELAAIEIQDAGKIHDGIRVSDITDEYAAEIIARYKKRSRFGETFHRLRKNRGAMVGLVILCVILLVILVSLTISWEAVTVTNIKNRLAPPSWENPFGADHIGRNVFLRVLYGARYSLLIGFSAVSIAAVIGGTLGTFAGFFGKVAETFIMRLTDVLVSIPGLLLGIVIISALGQSIGNLIMAVAIANIASFTRIARASVLGVRQNEYIEAAAAIGLSRVRSAFTQALPNALSPIIVTFSASLGTAIILSASLSFLGFGVPVPTPEWGALVAIGREHLRIAPWLTTFPGIFIMITILAFNLLGDGLRDALDPKLKK